MIWNLIQLDAFIRIGILVKHIFTMSPTFAAIYTIRNARPQPLINDEHGSGEMLWWLWVENEPLEVCRRNAMRV